MVGSASEVAAAFDTVLLATWSRRPSLGLLETRPGQHFTTLGVDEPGKQELAADLLEASFLVVDDHSLAPAAGVLAGADGSTRITADVSLGEFLRGGRSGRATRSGSTVYAPVGLPWQDLAIVWLAYRQAELNGVGSRTDLLA
ncbi:hypothetical protein [Streptomyces caelestis]|uniref:hypothetical protein n=1 Tax=Streptomyces caelestis TaxID=36816 RepID=UPI003665FCCB